MKTYLDCYPCLLTQALTAARIAGAGAEQQKKIMDEVAKMLPELPSEQSPPENALPIYRLINKISGNRDPYAGEKEADNRAALDIYDYLIEQLEASEDPLLTGVEMAISGNIIDHGTAAHFDLKHEVRLLLEQEHKAIQREEGRLFELARLRTALSEAKEILYLGDNAGEIVFDKAFIRTLRKLYPEITIRFAVRDRPIINDATLEDARLVGMEEVCEVISSGCPTPGTVLTYASSSFMDCMEDADLIISKGQGNFEALSGSGYPIFYLLRLKCPVVAEYLNASLGDVCLKAERE